MRQFDSLVAQTDDPRALAALTWMSSIETRYLRLRNVEAECQRKSGHLCGGENEFMNFTDIEYEVIESSAIIRLNRPDKLNALTYHTLKEIRQAIDKAVSDRTIVGLVITGNGRGFCSGLDAEVLADVTSGEAAPAFPARDTDELPGLFSYLLEVPKPVLAALNGARPGAVSSWH